MSVEMCIVISLLVFVIILLALIFSAMRTHSIAQGAGDLGKRLIDLEERVSVLEGYHNNRIPYKASQMVEDALALTNQAYWINELAVLQIRQDYEHFAKAQEITRHLQDTLRGLRGNGANQSPPVGND